VIRGLSLLMPEKPWAEGWGCWPACRKAVGRTAAEAMTCPASGTFGGWWQLVGRHALTVVTRPEADPPAVLEVAGG